MSIFHRHQWDEVGRRFMAPPDRLKRVSADDAQSYEPFNYALFGFTSIEFRCVGCGRVWFQEVLGNVTDTKVGP